MIVVSEPIRVLMVNYKMHCAGIESFIMNMYRNIDRSKVQFDFLVHYTERQIYDDEIESLGGRIYRLSIREDNNFIKYFKDLKKFFKEHPEYKIVHGHMESFGLFYLRAAKKAGVPVRIAHSHNDKVDPSLKGAVKNILNKPFKYYATDYMACSKESAEYLFGDRDCWVIPNAIDVQKFLYNEKIREEVRKDLNIENNFVVGHIGRFNIQKNHNFLIDVFRKVADKNPRAILLCVGEGPLQEEIKKKVKELSLEDKVLFLGVRKDAERLYQAMDVFVFPSLYEGLGIVGIEAQASGLKMVCSDGIPDLAKVTPNVTSLALKDSTDKWAEIINFCDNGYARCDMYEHLSRSGFDVKNIALELQEFYLKVLGR